MREDERESATLHADILPFPLTGERRLRMALRRLEAAVVGQREAVAAFRAELGVLNAAMAGLGDSTQTLRRKLDETAEDTMRAQSEALRLQTTAQAMSRLV